MPNKTEEYLALACKTADSFSRQWEHWAEFLITAARLYKYSYPDQLMIYAQRPDATACAEYDVWNNKMNRYVRRGSKGIALLDESGGYPRLHYVFDVSDTAPRRNALYPDLWQINDSLKEPVRSMLAENYGVHSESFGQQLADVAGKLVQSYWDNNSSDILGIVDGSYFLPNLTLNQPRKQLNQYGRMRRNYLMEQRPVAYSTMLMNGSLYRKSGYSKAFLEAHREEITLHKAAKAAEGQGVGCGVRRAADQEESSLPGLPQSTGRDARTGSCVEKRRTIFCRGKGHHRENPDPINECRRGAFPVGRHPRRIFVYAAGLRCWIYSVKTQSYSLPVTASKSMPCFCCPVFSGGERQSFLLETVRGYDIIRMDRKITFEQL